MDQEMQTPKTKGQIAYEAYAESLEWKSGVTGHTLPQYSDEKVTAQIKSGWEAAAKAVINSYHNDTATAKAA